MIDLINQLSDKAWQKAEKKAMPGWMDPMLARLTHDYFSYKPNRLRHLRYKGLRDDIAPQDVTKEEESQTTELDGGE